MRRKLKVFTAQSKALAVTMRQLLPVQLLVGASSRIADEAIQRALYRVAFRWRCLAAHRRAKSRPRCSCPCILGLLISASIIRSRSCAVAGLPSRCIRGATSGADVGGSGGEAVLICDTLAAARGPQEGVRPGSRPICHEGRRVSDSNNVSCAVAALTLAGAARRRV